MSLTTAFKVAVKLYLYNHQGVITDDAGRAARKLLEAISEYNLAKTSMNYSNAVKQLESEGVILRPQPEGRDTVIRLGVSLNQTQVADLKKQLTQATRLIRVHVREKGLLAKSSGKKSPTGSQTSVRVPATEQGLAPAAEATTTEPLREVAALRTPPASVAKGGRTQRRKPDDKPAETGQAAGDTAADSLTTTDSAKELLAKSTGSVAARTKTAASGGSSDETPEVTPASTPAADAVNKLIKRRDQLGQLKLVLAQQQEAAQSQIDTIDRKLADIEQAAKAVLDEQTTEVILH